MNHHSFKNCKYITIIIGKVIYTNPSKEDAKEATDKAIQRNDNSFI